MDNQVLIHNGTKRIAHAFKRETTEISFKTTHQHTHKKRHCDIEYLLRKIKNYVLF